jgi:bacterioferritin
MTKETLIKLLNHALELEHAAYIQYLSHAEVLAGPTCEPIIARIKEIAGDEKKHGEQFRNLIGLLGGIPSMVIAPVHTAKNLKEILEVNLKAEKEAVDTYKKILAALKAEGSNMNYYDMMLEHEIRHVIIDENEHITELELLLDRQGASAK